MESIGNRQQRRLHLQKNRFYGESKNTHLTVVKGYKYLRHKQIIHTLTGRKTILHYILK